MKKIIHACTVVLCVLSTWRAVAEERPNIVWIVVDDMSCHFGYEGESLVTTPRVDKLAKEGVVFSQAYATAPVCSTFRSAMITSMYQTTIGAHHHRSSRGALKNPLPEGVKTIPVLFKEAGYYTTITDATGTKKGKEDYNFDYQSSDLYVGSDWKKRAKGQPFFAQYQLRGGKIRNVETVLGTFEDTKLPEGEVDAIIMVDAYHEFSHPFEMAASMVKGLRPGGRIILIEYRGEDPAVQIKPLHKMTEQQCIKEMKAVGMDHVETLDFLPIQHFMTFQKPK